MKVSRVAFRHTAQYCNAPDTYESLIGRIAYALAIVAMILVAVASVYCAVRAWQDSPKNCAEELAQGFHFHRGQFCGMGK